MRRCIVRCAILITFLFGWIGGMPNAYAAFGKETFPRQNLIRELKQFEKEQLGYEDTKNFLTYSEDIGAFYNCYYIEKFTLPDSVDGLHYADGTESGCPNIDEKKFDVFFYPAQAVAGIGGTPLTRSLARAKPIRLIEVVFHEDFHEQIQERIPSSFDEAAATFVGFMAAEQFAKIKFGSDSPEYADLVERENQFYSFALIAVAYHSLLKHVYTAYATGAMSERRVQEIQTIIFPQLVYVENNAHLAFEITYMKWYPLMYEIYLIQGGDLKRFVATMKKVAEKKPANEEETLRYLKELVPGV